MFYPKLHHKQSPTYALCMCIKVHTHLAFKVPCNTKNGIKGVGTGTLWHRGSGVTSWRGNMVLCIRFSHWNWWRVVIICHVNEKWGFAKALGCEVIGRVTKPRPVGSCLQCVFCSSSNASSIIVVVFSGARVCTSALRLQSRQCVFCIFRNIQEGGI